LVRRKVSHVFYRILIVTRFHEQDKAAGLSLRAPPLADARVRPQLLVRNKAHSGTRSRLLRLGVGLVVVDSQCNASRCRRWHVCPQSLQTTRIVTNPDPVWDQPQLEPTLSVVWQSRSVSVLHPPGRMGAMAGAVRQALGAR
jgi:hypothetical protein